MALRPLHAFIAAAGLCAIIGASLLPPAHFTLKGRGAPHPLPVENNRIRGELNVALRNWRSAVLRDSVRNLLAAQPRSAKTKPVVLTSRELPPAIVSLSQRVLDQTWNRLGVDSAAVQLAVLVLPVQVFDNFSESSGFEFSLPDDSKASGDVCLSIIRLHSLDYTLSRIARLLQYGTRWDSGETEPVTAFGPCAFFAAYGKPGPRIAEWLANRDYAPAMSSNWNRQGETGLWRFAPGEIIGAWFSNYSDISLTTLEGRRCWLGNTSECEATVLSPVQRAPAFRRIAGVYDGDVRYTNPWSRNEGRFLTDMLREIGDGKFAQFWTSPETPAVAFHNATGETLGAWTHRWVNRIYGRTIQASKVPASSMAWGVFVALGCVVVAAAVTGRRTVS
jgi:hypothetical protein